ncbi:MAG: bifunctional adenosylcobinamide kinase/adenosylcobinamide-phosphate guanylyltransferase [Magnetococcales bacterium]|nr:bifunctional adenosylcobinamide kinase/adenosylcobinamide-phosphate guanylyltransferase [Magnetococcales bacterium]
MAIELILGGARSGKSSLAEDLAKKTGLDVTYVATAQARDAEMQTRILQHKKRRPSHWQLVEEQLKLSSALATHAKDGRLLLVDCLTLWLSNILLQPDWQQLWEKEKRDLLEIIPTLASPIILVANETGLGIVPMGELSRNFVDESGWLHQDLAKICDRVIFTVAGLPMVLKGEKL